MFRLNGTRFWADVGRICMATTSECKAPFLSWWFLGLHASLYRTLLHPAGLSSPLEYQPRTSRVTVRLYLQIPRVSRVQRIMYQAVLSLMTTPVEGRRLLKGARPEKYEVLDRRPASASCHAVFLSLITWGWGHVGDTC